MVGEYKKPHAAPIPDFTQDNKHSKAPAENAIGFKIAILNRKTAA